MDAGALPEFTGAVAIDGKSYDVPVPTEAHYLDLSGWLENRALARIERQRGTLPESVYQERYDAALRLVCAGVLSHGTPEFDRALMAFETREQLLWIVLHSRYPDITREQVKGVWHGIFQQIIAVGVEQAKKQSQPQPQPPIP